VRGLPYITRPAWIDGHADTSAHSGSSLSDCSSLRIEPIDGPPSIIHIPSFQSAPASSHSPSTSTSDTRAHSRTLGTVVLTGDEITGLFDEYVGGRFAISMCHADADRRFFTCHHPLFPLFLNPGGPDEMYGNSVSAFWAICATGARPRPDHPVPRARTSNLCLALIKEVKAHVVGVITSSPRPNYRVIQALLLLIEFGYLLRADEGWVSTTYVSYSSESRGHRCIPEWLVHRIMLIA
jgi:hypothetical protein